MNQTQSKVWDYLMNGGDRSAREGALKSLTTQNFFGVGRTDKQSQEHLSEFISRVQDTYCVGGIERFRKAVLPPEMKVDQVTITMVIDLERTNPDSKNYGVTDTEGDVTSRCETLLAALGIKAPPLPGNKFTTFRDASRQVLGSTMKVEVTKSAGR